MSLLTLELNRELDKSLAIQSRPEIKKLYQRAFQKKKNEMITEFLNHPVTVEIKGGISANNISKTLGGGSGNLFSFIGFDSGYDPIEPITSLLERTTLDYINASKRTINYRVTLPTAKEIFSVTPMPWASGRSWAKGIETGISGLGYYLRKSTDSSRSGLGVQSPRRVRRSGSRFKNVQYISALINKYEKEFKNLQIS
tara:strand:+ start:4705 stop:5298 length:594 start_codon:yes stop_codon:yes gene_type:complete